MTYHEQLKADYDKARFLERKLKGLHTTVERIHGINSKAGRDFRRTYNESVTNVWAIAMRCERAGVKTDG